MNTRLSAPLRGDYALAVGKFTTGELQRLAQRLEEPRSVVLTPALEMVWRLIKRDRSGIISIPQGAVNPPFWRQSAI